MKLSEETIEKIKGCLKSFIGVVNKRRFVDEVWDDEIEKQKNPFNSRLVPSTIWMSSKYERSFVTSFGGQYEVISKVIGKQFWGESSTQKTSKFEIYTLQLNHIYKVLNDLDHKEKKGHPDRREPDWDKITKELLLLQTGDKVSVNVNSDLYLYNKEKNKQSFIELKSPLPNKDQSKVSLEKMLKLFCGFHDCDITTDYFFSLPFNPFLDRKYYSHSFPEVYFQMKISPVVLIGKEHWDYVGEDGVYEELLEICDEVGDETRPVILGHLFDRDNKKKE